MNINKYPKVWAYLGNMQRLRRIIERRRNEMARLSLELNNVTYIKAASGDGMPMASDVGRPTERKVQMLAKLGELQNTVLNELECAEENLKRSWEYISNFISSYEETMIMMIEVENYTFEQAAKCYDMKLTTFKEHYYRMIDRLEKNLPGDVE